MTNLHTQKHWCCVAVLTALVSCSAVQAALTERLVFCCEADNDLYTALQAAGCTSQRYDSAADAVTAAPMGGAVAILADGYPLATTLVDQAVLDTAAAKGLRLYIEYPAALPPSLTPLPGPLKTQWERSIIASDFFAPELEPLRITEIFDCHFMSVEAENPHIVASRVAGFDTAVYGLTETQYPILYQLPTDQNIMVATTKLSNFVTGRYAPTEVWLVVWGKILEWLCPGELVPVLSYTPTVRPYYSKTESLPADVELQALTRAADWFVNSRFLRHPDWPQWALDLAGVCGIADMPEPDWPVGDGSLGMVETFNSTLNFDGSQKVRYGVRADCMGEVTMASALDGVINSDPCSTAIATNLLNYIYFDSPLAQGPRADPHSPSYGLVSWCLDNAWGPSYWGDDNARSILGALAATTLLNDQRWDESLLRCILANFRTTGTYGFREGCIREWDLQANGWEYYWNQPYVFYSPGYEGYLWACFLRAYDKTGYEPFLERTKTAIRMTMEVYPNWYLNASTERSRALLPLAWLVRVEDTPEHRGWLYTVASDLLTLQQDCGAIRESLGGIHQGVPSNAAYGTSETTLIQEEGDPAADMLYNCNFAFLGLHEAAAATGDAFYADAEDKLAEFLCRIQIRSEAHPELDGAWYRGFDFEKWESWGSNADAGWGVWCTESGWTVSWIGGIMGLRHMNTSLWELTQGSAIDEQLLDELLPSMFPAPIPDAVEQVNGNLADNLSPLDSATRAEHSELGTGLKLGRTAVFDGTGGRFLASDLSGQLINGAHAIELWFQTDTATDLDPANQYLVTFAGKGKIPVASYSFTPDVYDHPYYHETTPPKLTDGIVIDVPRELWDTGKVLGWYLPEFTGPTIFFDLGQTKDLGQVEVDYVSYESSAVYAPDDVTISFSNLANPNIVDPDNMTDWTGAIVSTDFPAPYRATGHTLISLYGHSARWVRMKFTNSGYSPNTWTMLSEVTFFKPNDVSIVYGFNGHELELFHADAPTDGFSMTDTGWHHLVFVVYGNGTVGVADKIVTYLDGNIVSTLTNNDKATIDLLGILAVGGTTVPNNSFSGMVDEFAVYNLTDLADEAAVDAKAAELAEHFNLAFTSLDYSNVVLADNPAMYWNFNEGGANECIAADLSCDGIVDFIDLAIMLDHWLETSKHPRE